MPVTVTPLSARSLGDLKTRIADEIARSDLTSQIALAIEQAIEEAAGDHFWFMDTTDISVPLVAGQWSYGGSAIADLYRIDRARIFVGSVQFTMRLMNDDMRSRLVDGTPPQGQPFAYSRYGDTLNVYPVPSQSYPLYLDGITKGSALSSDGDGNFWTDVSQGEPLVRALAKRQLYADVTRNLDQAMAQDKLAQRYREQLLEQTHDRLATNEMLSFGV